MASWSSRGLRSHRIALLLAWWLGLYQPPDRVALQAIWDALVPDDPGFRMLFVGVRAYTRKLTRSRPRAQLVTVDSDRRMSLFGARRHHAVALQALGATGESGFDAVFVNGVFGWGIDTADDADSALRAVWSALRPGGVLVLGVNEDRPTTPDLTRVGALATFREIAPPPFHVHRHVVPSPLEGTHTFLFFARP